MEQKTSGFAITALVTGIVGAVLAFIPVVRGLGLLCGIVATVFGSIALAKRKDKTISLVGLILGIVACVGSIIMIYLSINNAVKAINNGSGTFRDLVDEFKNEIEEGIEESKQDGSYDEFRKAIDDLKDSY